MAEGKTVPGGFFLAFEGGENTGKSTQAKMTAEALRCAGWDVELTREPGATHIGAQIRALLLDPSSEDMVPEAETLLYAADRAQHVRQVIWPAMSRGAVVITDRYTDSSVAYQGAARHLGEFSVTSLNEWAVCGQKPHLTVLLDMDPARARSRQGARPDRIERLPLAFHVRVREAFLKLAEAAPRRYIVADAAPGPEDVHEAVMSRLGAWLEDFAADLRGDGSSSVSPPRSAEVNRG